MARAVAEAVMEVVEVKADVMVAVQGGHCEADDKVPMIVDSRWAQWEKDDGSEEVERVTERERVVRHRAT